VNDSILLEYAEPKRRQSGRLPACWIHDGTFRFGQRDLKFDEEEYGGFRGYQLLLIANDFFVVRYLGADAKRNSDPIIVHWDDEKKQFESTLKIPKAVSDIIYDSG
jgi:hypothetical protein